MSTKNSKLKLASVAFSSRCSQDKSSMTSSNANFLNYDVLHVPVKNYDKATLKRKEKLKAIKVKESDNFLDLNNGFIPPCKLKTLKRQSHAPCDSSASERSEPSRRSSQRTSVKRTSSIGSNRVERRTTGLYLNNGAITPPNAKSLNRQLYPSCDSSAAEMSEPSHRSSQRSTVTKTSPISCSRVDRRTSGLSKSLQHHPGHSYIHRATTCSCCPHHEGPQPRHKRLIGVKPPQCDGMVDGIFRDGPGLGLGRSHTR